MIVILTALDLEYQAVRGHLTDPRVHRHTAGTRFELGRQRVRERPIEREDRPVDADRDRA